MSKPILTKILRILDKPSVDECELDAIRALIRKELQIKPKAGKKGIIPSDVRKHFSRPSVSEGFKYAKAGWLADKEFSTNLCGFCSEPLAEKLVSFWGTDLSTSKPTSKPVHVDCARFALHADYWAYRLGMVCTPIGPMKEAA